MIEEEKLDWIMFIVSCPFWGLWTGTQVATHLSCFPLIFRHSGAPFLFFFLFSFFSGCGLCFDQRKKNTCPFVERLIYRNKSPTYLGHRVAVVGFTGVGKF